MSSGDRDDGREHYNILEAYPFGKMSSDDKDNGSQNDKNDSKVKTGRTKLVNGVSAGGENWRRTQS